MLAISKETFIMLSIIGFPVRKCQYHYVHGFHLLGSHATLSILYLLSAVNIKMFAKKYCKKIDVGHSGCDTDSTVAQQILRELEFIPISDTIMEILRLLYN